MVVAWAIWTLVRAASPVAPEGQLRAALQPAVSAELAEHPPAFAQLERSAHPAPALAQLEERSHDGPVSSTSTDSYSEQLVDSLGEFVMGFIAILFSVTALWINERRSADQWALFANGQSAVAALADDTPDGTLVHTTGATTTADALADEPFGMKVSGAARLRRRGRIYQWVEKQHSSNTNNIGGSRSTTTTYYCEKEWCDAWVDGSQFRSGSKDNGPIVTHEDLHRTVEATTVKLGRTTLSLNQVERLDKWVLETPQAATAFGKDFKLAAASLLYAGKGTSGAPEVGDIEMKIEKVPCGDTTVVALLVADSFVPYRPVDLGLWHRLTKGSGGEDEQQALIAAGRDDGGPRKWSCTSLCCICNLVETAFHGLSPVQIDHIAEKQQDVTQAFEDMANMETHRTWLIRFGCWLAMYLGLVMLFSPLIALLNFLPFLASFGSFIVWVFAFIVTVCTATLIISVAYLAYRPFVALLGFLVVGALMGLTQAPPPKAF